MDDVLYELKYTILAMLDKNVQKGDITPDEMMVIKEAVCTLHYIKEIDEIEARNGWDRNYSERSSYERGRSPNTGRYISRDRGSYNNGRSYHDGKDAAMRALEKAMNNVSSDRERQAIMDSMDVLNRE